MNLFFLKELRKMYTEIRPKKKWWWGFIHIFLLLAFCVVLSGWLYTIIVFYDKNRIDGFTHGECQISNVNTYISPCDNSLCTILEYIGVANISKSSALSDTDDSEIFPFIIVRKCKNEDSPCIIKYVEKNSYDCVENAGIWQFGTRKDLYYWNNTEFGIALTCFVLFNLIVVCGLGILLKYLCSLKKSENP